MASPAIDIRHLSCTYFRRPIGKPADCVHPKRALLYPAEACRACPYHKTRREPDSRPNGKPKILKRRYDHDEL